MVAVFRGKRRSEQLEDGPAMGPESLGLWTPNGTALFRTIRSSDIEQISKIEKFSFSSPWSLRFFLQELQAPCSRSFLAHIGERVVGYIIYWILPEEADIHNLAVHPGFRRLGIGRSLLESVIREARGRGLRRVTLEVRKSNSAAQKLYISLGFTPCGVRKGYYSDDGEDALLMALDLSGV